MNYRDMEDDLDIAENRQRPDWSAEAFVVFAFLLMAIAYLVWRNR